MKDPILYVEDGADDVLFMQRAFKTVAPQVDLRVIMDGREASEFFAPSHPNAKPKPPLALVLLDLNLPGQSGLQVLAGIRTKSEYAKVPVVIFSASSQQQDIDACYAAGCNAYVVKPSDPQKLNSRDNAHPFLALRKPVLQNRRRGRHRFRLSMKMGL